MSSGVVYAVVKDALSKFDNSVTSVAALMTDVGVDCFVEGYCQCRDAVVELLMAAGVDIKIINDINNLKAAGG